MSASGDKQTSPDERFTPPAKLYYNDYSAEGGGAKSNAVYKLVKDLKNAEVPIDGVGWQMHLENGATIGRDYVNNAKRFADLGLGITITELDVRMKMKADDAALERQAKTYAAVTTFCLMQANCRALVLWGFTDRESWIPGFFKGFGAALIFDRLYDPKPAYEAMLRALSIH